MAGRWVVVAFLAPHSLFAIAVGAFFVVVLANLWLKRDRRSDVALGPALFSIKVRAKVRGRGRGRYSAFTNTSGGWFDLTIHESVVRLHSGAPAWLRSVIGGDFTFDADRCEVGGAKISSVWSMPNRGDDYVVLRGATTRGWFELGVRPQSLSADELEHELLRAGFHRTDESSAA